MIESFCSEKQVTLIRIKMAVFDHETKPLQQLNQRMHKFKAISCFLGFGKSKK